MESAVSSLILANYYLFGVICLIPLWAFMLWWRKGSRREMLSMGIVMGIAGVITAIPYATYDYWNPTYILGYKIPIEDFLYGFIYGGITTELYEFVLRKHSKKTKLARGYIRVCFFGVTVTVLAFIIIVHVLHLNSIIAYIIPPFIIGIYTIAFRRDLLIPSLLSGTIVMIFTFIWQKGLLIIYPDMFTNYWMLDNLSNIFIGGVLLEELLFAFVIGFGIAHVHEFITGQSV